jgi:DNA-binding CsgD family transcriptional regulator
MAAVEKLDERARVELGEAVGPSPPRPLQPGPVADLMNRTADAALERLREVGEADAAADELVDLFVRAQDLERELRRQILGRRARRRTELDRGLLRLGSSRGSAELLDRVCEEAVRACGLGRVLLSRVRDGVWSPWKLHSNEQADAAGAPAWLSTTAIALDDLPLERTVIVTGRPETIVDAVSDERVHQRLRRLMRFESFVVAPIAPAGQVIGLLHADSPSGRPAVDDDRDLLWIFAEGLGRLYERALMLERFEAQRTVIRESFAASESVMSGLAGEIDLVRLVRRGETAPPGTEVLQAGETPSMLDAELTRRERDVLSLMVKGHANAVIAEQLAISRSTVKSHVRSILSKIGAVNRAEAISRYHRLTQR